MNGYHEVRVFSVPIPELSRGWAAPENFKPFATDLDHEFGMAHVVCRKWHRGEDRTKAAWSHAEFDADEEETIAAHEFEGDARDFLPAEAFEPNQ